MSIETKIDKSHLVIDDQLKVSLLSALISALKKSKTIHFSTEPQNVTISIATSTQSAPFHANTRSVTLTPFGANCWVKIGVNPVATRDGVDCIPLTAFSPSYPIKVNAGEQVAVIAEADAFDQGFSVQVLNVFELT